MDFVSNIYWYMLNQVVQLLPDSNGFPLDIQGAITTVMATGKQLDFVINWTVVFACLQVIMAFEVGLLLFKLTLIIIDFVRGSGA